MINFSPNTMRSLNKVIQQRQKVIEKEILHNIETKIINACKANNNYLPNKFIETIIDQTIVL